MTVAADNRRLLAQRQIVDTAHKFVGKPYTYLTEDCTKGLGYNCYFLTRVVFARCDFWLPPDFTGQWELLCNGRPESWSRDLEDLQPADLIFTQSRQWNDETAFGKIGHVGITALGNEIIHASYEQRCVVKEPLESFLMGHPFRLCGRLLA